MGDFMSAGPVTPVFLCVSAAQARTERKVSARKAIDYAIVPVD